MLTEGQVNDHRGAAALFDALPQAALLIGVEVTTATVSGPPSLRKEQRPAFRRDETQSPA